MAERDNDICVRLEQVSKKFARSLKRSFVYGARDMGRAVLGRPLDPSLRPSEFWAVRDVSLELKRGQSLGIVGLNGSGKTTLLRMVSGILQPTKGRVQVDGRIAPMLALGAGFKPVLSGRENVFLNLSLLGVSEPEIRDRFDAIVDFADIGDALDAPLGTYSSGMKSRLGFACAVHTDPQLLVVDEVLAVGDVRFRMKCRNRINELRRAGTSLLLVSHSSVLIETLSDQCIYMRKGRVVAQGEPREVMRAYDEDVMAQATERQAQRVQQRAEARTVEADQPVVIESIEVQTQAAAEGGFFVAGLPGSLVLGLRSSGPCTDISVNVMVFDQTHQPGETVLMLMSSRDQGWLNLEAGTTQVRLNFPQVGLRAGTYRVKASISRGGQHDLLDAMDDVRLVVRDAGRAANSLYFQPRDWACERGVFDGAFDASQELEQMDDLLE